MKKASKKTKPKAKAKPAPKKVEEKPKAKRNWFKAKPKAPDKPTDTEDRQYFHEEEDHKKDERRDKIFGNDFNTGNIKSENFPDIKVESSFSSSFLDDCYDAEEYMTRKDLMEKVYDVFKNSQWGSLPLDKKFSKELMPFIFNDLYKGLCDQGYPTVDIFICIAEFMDVSYEKVYDVAGIKVKERILKELESKYKVLSKKKINRLF
jgi:hypothetical protein